MANEKPLVFGEMLSAQAGFIFFYLSAFVFLSSAALPDIVRPTFLTVGAFSILALTAAHVVVVASLRSAMLVLALSVMTLFWIFAFPAAVNGSDDNAAYLIFADMFYDRFSETIQPLSERRLFSVGGNYAFQAPVIHWLGLGGLAIVEPVFGLLLLATVVLSSRIRPILSVFAILGFLALLPAAGSKVLANTSSAFVLGALSLALIVTTLRMIETRKARSIDIALILALPLAAASFRPTTAPFNALIAMIGALVIISTGRSGIARLIIIALPTFALFTAALVPYYQVGQTFLYPVLGKGTHISAEFTSICGSLEVTTHLKNIAGIFMNDIFLLITLAVSIGTLIAGCLEQRVLLAFSAILIIYLAFVVLMVITTGGLSSMRYVFPVSLALFVTSLIVLGSTSAPIFTWLEARLPGIRAIALLTFIAILVGIRIFGQDVVTKRLKQYHLEASVQMDIEAVAETVNAITAPNQRTLLIGINEGRFLTPLLDNGVLIMDQPGVLAPWRTEIYEYKEGLQKLLVESLIRVIVVNTLNCSKFSKFDPRDAEGWRGINAFAAARNEAALCSFLGVRMDFGKFTILILD